jgi:hypothetical protein
MHRALLPLALALGCSSSPPPGAAAPADPAPPPAAGSVAPAPPPGAPGPTASGPPLELTLTVRPKPILTSAESAEFRLELEVKNPGKEAVKPNLERSVLYVNDKPAKQWADAVSVHPKNELWNELPPGKTITFSFTFQRRVPVRAGDYTFVVVLGPNKSQPAFMHVE